ncbi:MAG TPA: lipocalin-like domain-containing protein [Stellaceae bacterium]|nr:lipocalin-like domain-containing protein [Stellaceae bacterium]
MKQKLGFLVVAMLAVFCVAFSAAEAATVQKAKLDKTKLVGSWTLVSISNTSPDGNTRQTFGQGDGIMIFGANGTFVQVVARGDLPKIASNNRTTATADENKAVVLGSLSLFGTYKLDPKTGALTLHVLRSSYPNWNNGDQMRTITSLTAGEMKWDVIAPSVGGSSAAVWKRAK